LKIYGNNHFKSLNPACGIEAADIEPIRMDNMAYFRTLYQWKKKKTADIRNVEPFNPISILFDSQTAFLYIQSFYI